MKVADGAARAAHQVHPIRRSQGNAYQIPKTLRLNLRRCLGRADQKGGETVISCHGYALPLHEGESNETVADLASRN